MNNDEQLLPEKDFSLITDDDSKSVLAVRESVHDVMASTGVDDVIKVEYKYDITEAEYVDDVTEAEYIDDVTEAEYIDDVILNTRNTSDNYASSSVGFKSSTPENRNRYEVEPVGAEVKKSVVVNRDESLNDVFTDILRSDSPSQSCDLGSLERDWSPTARDSSYLGRDSSPNECVSTIEVRELSSLPNYWVVQSRDLPSYSPDWLIQSRDHPSRFNVGQSYDEFFLGYRACAVESLSYLSNICETLPPSCESVRSVVDLPGLKRHLVKRESELRQLVHKRRSRQNLKSLDGNKRMTSQYLSTTSRDKRQSLRYEDLSQCVMNAYDHSGSRNREDDIFRVSQNSFHDNNVNEVSSSADTDRLLSNRRHETFYSSPITSRSSHEVGQARGCMFNTVREDCVDRLEDISQEESPSCSDRVTVGNTSDDSGLDVSVVSMNLSDDASGTFCSTGNKSTMTSCRNKNVTSELSECALTLTRAAEEDGRVRRVLLELFQLMDEEEEEEKKEEGEESIDMCDNTDSMFMS